MSTVSSGITNAEFLAMPDDGVERELIRGVVREREMTQRNRYHAATESRIVRSIGQWIDENPECSLDVLSGEAGSILSREPDTTVGIDIAVFTLATLHDQSNETSMVDGVPVLAVEILSPSDRHEDVHEKIAEYLRVGVSLVWEVDPDFMTVRVHRPGADPTMVNRSQVLLGENVLPGFEVPVKDLFPDWQ